MKINIKGAKSLAPEVKKRDQKNQKIDSVLDTPELQILQQDLPGVGNIFAPSIKVE